MSQYARLTDGQNEEDSSLSQATPSLNTDASASAVQAAAAVSAASVQLAQHAAVVRARSVPWEGFVGAGIISNNELEMLRSFDQRGSAVQSELLLANGKMYAGLFLKLLSKLNADEPLEYVLTLVDDLITEDEERVRLFHQVSEERNTTPLRPFLQLLAKENSYVFNKANKVLAILASTGSPLEGEPLAFYLDWISRNLRGSDDVTVESVVGALQFLLRSDAYRLAFFQQQSGVKGLLDILSNRRPNFQLQYMVIFDFWLLAFNPTVAGELYKTGAIGVLAEVLKTSNKEKVSRITIATYRNILVKASSKVASAAAMVQAKLLPHVTSMSARQWADEDMTEDITTVLDALRLSVQDMSSFDQYAAELRSGKLEWTPVHRSEKFWHENVMRLNENDFELVKLLVEVIQRSNTDAIALAVAAHDIGEYVRRNPRGKSAVEKYNGKSAVMQLMGHRDNAVRYEALLAVQKLMVNNWEYLGTQLPPTNAQAVKAGGKK
eukprot:Opistho-2@59710